MWEEIQKASPDADDYDDLFGDLPGGPEKGGESEDMDIDDIPINVLTTVDEYTELVESGDNYVIHFTAPWSKACESFIPLFVHTSQQPDFNIKISFHAVDITQHNEIADAAGVTQVPTIGYGMGYDTGHTYTGADSKRFMRVLSALNGSSPENLSTIANPKLDGDYLKRQSRRKINKRQRKKMGSGFDRSHEDLLAMFNTFEPFRRMFGEGRSDECGVTGLNTDDIPEIKQHEIPDIESIDLDWANLDLNSKEDMLKVVEVMRDIKQQSTRHERARAEQFKAAANKNA